MNECMLVCPFLPPFPSSSPRVRNREDLYADTCFTPMSSFRVISVVEQLSASIQAPPSPSNPHPFLLLVSTTHPRIQHQHHIPTISSSCAIGQMVRVFQTHRIVFPVLNRIHCGIGRFCFCAFASFCFVRKDLWDYIVIVR